MGTIFHCRVNKNSFSQERLCTWPHFESSGKWPIMIDDISLLFLSGCSCVLKLSSHILTFKLQRTANEYAAKPWIYKRPDQQNHTLSRHTEFCKADRTTWKLTLQDINTTPKGPKTERGRNHRQRFRPFRPQRAKQLSTAVARSALQNSECLLRVYICWSGLL